MITTLADSRTVIAVVVVVCAVALSLLLWRVTRPPGFSSPTLPPVMRRGVAWWLGALFTCAIAACGWIALRRPLGLPRDGVYRYVPMMLGLAPILLVNPLYLWRTAWLRRALAASNGKLCTHCAYDVSGLAPSGTCPECGGAYDVEADAKLWQGVKRR